VGGKEDAGDGAWSLRDSVVPRSGLSAVGAEAERGVVKYRVVVRWSTAGRRLSGGAQAV
jgi:hypothetical protein